MAYSPELYAELKKTYSEGLELKLPDAEVAGRLMGRLAARSGPAKDGSSVCFAGPSGAGKSTLIKRLQAEFPADFGFSVSHTTREPREGEENGREYAFVSKDDMEAQIAANKFLEHATVHQHLYGTSYAAVKAVTDQHRICVLDVDVQGVAQIMSKDSDSGLKPPLFVFIAPPSLAVVEQRLRARGTESEEAIAVRVGAAKGELDAAAKMPFDLRVVNDDIEAAYATVRAFLLDHIVARAALRAAPA